MIVVEFSVSQKSFHVQTVNEMLVNNLITILKRQQTDFLPVAICETIDEADKFIEGNRKNISDFTIYKDTNGNTVVN